MNWSPILQSVLTYVLPLLTIAFLGVAVTWIKKEWGLFSAAHKDWAWDLEQAAQLAVTAAEQSGLSGFITDKKAYAIGIAQAYLDAKGFKVDLTVIDAAIEAAVWEYLNKDNPAKNGKTSSPTPPEVPVTVTLTAKADK
jgi:hypothetical protein